MELRAERSSVWVAPNSLRSRRVPARCRQSGQSPSPHNRAPPPHRTSVHFRAWHVSILGVKPEFLYRAAEMRIYVIRALKLIN
jgi:hypothetical protein